jgi:hypothetical protein
MHDIRMHEFLDQWTVVVVSTRVNSFFSKTCSLSTLGQDQRERLCKMQAECLAGIGGIGSESFVFDCDILALRYCFSTTLSSY